MELDPVGPGGWVVVELPKVFGIGIKGQECRTLELGMARSGAGIYGLDLGGMEWEGKS